MSSAQTLSMLRSNNEVHRGGATGGAGDRALTTTQTLTVTVT